MVRFKIIKATRAIRIFFGKYTEMEEKHKLFKMPRVQADGAVIEGLLEGHSYYYNVASTTYKKQIYTCRKLIDHDHQIHLRFYTDGWVSGHYELRPDSHCLEHLDGVELRPLSEQERQEIKEMLT